VKKIRAKKIERWSRMWAKALFNAWWKHPELLSDQSNIVEKIARTGKVNLFTYFSPKSFPSTQEEDYCYNYIKGIVGGLVQKNLNNETI